MIEATYQAKSEAKRGSWIKSGEVNGLYHRTRSVLHAKFPRAFPARGAPPIPLRIGIGLDLAARLDEIGLTEMETSVFLRQYTQRHEYLAMLVSGSERVNLDGSPAGPIEEVHKVAAAKRIEKKRKRHALLSAGEHLRVGMEAVGG
jgi:ProP effector